MKRHQLFLLLALVLVSNTAQAQSVQPTLTAEPTRNVTASRGITAQAFKIDSAIMKETRRIQIVFPDSYAQSASTRRYPVTVIVDGEYLMPNVAVVTGELARNGQIPESVLVAIENVGGEDSEASNQKRVYDLTPPGLSVSGSDEKQGGDLFLDFIERELLPAVDKQFRTAAPRFFVGISSGGVLATYAAATRSTYAAVLSLDAPIFVGENWLAKKLIARASQSGKPVRYASLEARFGWQELLWKTLVSSAPSTWKLYREKLQLEGHETMQMVGAYIAFRQLFSDYSRLSAPTAPTTSIIPYYKQVGESLGADVMPPKRLLQDVVNDLLIEGRGAAAREAYKLLSTGYGEPADSAKLLARISLAEKLPPPTETVEALVATPFPKPEEVTEYLGDWVGDVWMGANGPRPGRVTLSIRVESGKVVCELVRRNESGELIARPVEYLKVTPDGLTYGFMNGMRPRAMVLFEGKLSGDTLAGKKRFGGISFEEKGPPLQFLFKRAKPENQPSAKRPKTAARSEG
jgi:predicted alpha/beta superfamily hydrolase